MNVGCPLFWLGVIFSVISNVCSAELKAKAGQEHTTRLVEVFTQKEELINQSFREVNRKKLANLVLENFELVYSGNLKSVSSLDNSIEAFQIDKFKSLVIDDLAARDYGSIVIVNFYLKDIDHRNTWFLVDIWKRSNNDYKLQNRFISKPGNLRTKVPGFLIDNDVIQKKY